MFEISQNVVKVGKPVVRYYEFVYIAILSVRWKRSILSYLLILATIVYITGPSETYLFRPKCVQFIPRICYWHEGKAQLRLFI